MNSGNLFHDIPAQLPAERAQTLATAGSMRVERIVSRGHCSPPGFWYDQEDAEWVLLVQGEAVLRFEQGNRSVRLMPGSYVNIAAHEKHRVDWTTADTETIWLAIFYRQQ